MNRISKTVIAAALSSALALPALAAGGDAHATLGARIAGTAPASTQVESGNAPVVDPQVRAQQLLRAASLPAAPAQTSAPAPAGEASGPAVGPHELARRLILDQRS
jgi:hypothetical protein